MIRRTALLSALTLGLLLGACSSKNKDGADGGENVEAQAAGEAKAQAEAPVEAAPPAPRIDYWKVVGPLVAGSYSGKCVRMPDARNMDATITVGADGKTSAGGLDADFHMAKTAMLTRSRDDKGQFSTIAVLAIGEGKGGMLTLQAGQAAKEGNAGFARDGIGLMCSNVGFDKLNAQPLYSALPKLLNWKKQTISCLDTSNLLVRRDVDVEVVDGVVKIGDASFDMKAAVSEGFTVDDAGGSLALAIVMPEERVISVMYDGAGKLTQVTAFHKQESTHSCTVKD
jgi:hypothetical protein